MTAPRDDVGPEELPAIGSPEDEVWNMRAEERIEAAIRSIQPPWVADEMLAPLIAEREWRERGVPPPGVGTRPAAPRRSRGPMGRPRVGLGSGPSAVLRVRVGEDVLNALETSAAVRGTTVPILVRRILEEQFGGEEDPEELLDPEEAEAWRLHPPPDGRPLGRVHGDTDVDGSSGRPG